MTTFFWYFQKKVSFWRKSAQWRLIVVFECLYTVDDLSDWWREYERVFDELNNTLANLQRFVWCICVDLSSIWLYQWFFCATSYWSSVYVPLVTDMLRIMIAPKCPEPRSLCLWPRQPRWSRKFKVCNTGFNYAMRMPMKVASSPGSYKWGPVFTCDDAFVIKVRSDQELFIKL